MKYQVIVGGTKVVAVNSLKEASKAVRNYIDNPKRARPLGNSAWYRSNPNVGTVTDQSGKPVARVSYNGRVWEHTTLAQCMNAKEIDIENENENENE